MKVIKSDVEILEQQPGIIGMFKHVERVARTSYHSENSITEDSWKKFCDMLLKRGHWACFEHGTVYLKIPKVIMQVEAIYFRNNHYTKFTEDNDYYYFTTNYRELLHFCQTYKKDPEYLLNNYWSEPDYNFPPRVTSKWVCSRGVSHELVRHRAMCLAGNSVILGFGSKNWTIEELYNWKDDFKRKGRLNLINIRIVNESNGIVEKGKIKDIIQTGEKECFKVVTKSGRSITTSLDHLFYIGDGNYKKLNDLKVGDFIMANGLELLENEDWLRDYYLNKNHTRKEISELAGCCEALVYKAFKKFGIVKPKSNYPNRKAGYCVKGSMSKENREKLSQRQQGEGNVMWKDFCDKGESALRIYSRKHYKLDKCEICGSTSDLEQHHFDKNPFNYKKENLITLCRSCHRMVHSLKTIATFKDEIVSIESAGKIMCYDMEVDGSYHNFVADGLVVHNCFLQSSQRYIAYDIEKNGGEVTFIIPQWVYKLRDDENLDGEELWTKLKQTNKTVEARDKFWKACEQEYIWERQLAEDTKLKPEDARGVLCNDVMTEVCVTSFLEDLDYIPKDDTTEKAGFFYLRTAPDAHPDFRVLAEKFKSLVDTKFKEYYENIK